jgi:hypothetical protein
MGHAKDKQTLQNVDRIVGWLIEHRAEFEQEGVDEHGLTGSIGMSEAEVTAAVDYLENHEDVVRWPKSIDTGPRFVLKPGRGWPQLLEKGQKT